MEAPYEAQVNLIKEMKDLPTKFETQTKSPKDRDLIDSLMERLEDNFHTFQVQHTAILNDVNFKKTNAYFTEKVAMQGEDAFYYTKAFFKRRIRELDKKEDHNSTLLSPSPTSEPTYHKLPPIQIPQFTGKQSEWANFRDLFGSLVHKNIKYGPGDKFYFLRFYVIGKALDIFKDIRLYGENYSNAWLALTK